MAMGHAAPQCHCPSTKRRRRREPRLAGYRAFEGGSPHTSNRSGYDAKDFRQTIGPSARLIIDLGNWDHSRAVNYPGQSGDPNSPHYRDLAPMWLKG